MQYRIDPKSGNKLSVLGYGCMRFPKKLSSIDMEETEKLILNAIKEGINYFDTAYIYNGSETALGQIIKKNELRKKIFLASKLPLFMIKKKSDFDKYFNESLNRLQTDYIDYYLMHAMSDMTQWEKLCSLGIEDWIEEKKKKGQIKEIGFSFHGSAPEFSKILDAYKWEFCLIQYNYSNPQYQAGVIGLKQASRKGMAVMIMEPLLGGKLATGLSKETTQIFNKVNPDYTLVEWAFKWLWNQKEITTVLSGMSTLNDIKENVTIADKSKIGMLKRMEIDTYKKVIDTFNASYKIPCTGCNYCVPCPVGVNIPSCFAAYNTSYSIGFISGIKQHMMSTGAFSEKESRASMCIKCGKCETHCPQNIKIRDNLDLVKKRLEPFWYHFAIFATRKFLSKNKKNKS